ncbi:WD40-repeat-containing domain protein [Globomyces pollinis-pini]|nr:WD40-repeat-containing domain protein [Globomyces pollinis-pini]
MCSIDEINRKIDWQGVEKSRNELLITQTKFILPSMCIPPNRLNILLDQALQLQRQNCLYHNEDANECLLVDHSCQREKFPNHTTHLLEEHRDEVWFMAFSHDGTKLASASRDARAIIWDVENFKILYVLDDHKKAISYLSWSPDDSYLLTASNDTTLKLWNTKTGQMIQTFSKHTDSVTSCVWHPSGSSFVSGSVEKNMYHWNINGEILFHWPGVRIMDLAMTSDGKKLIACSEKRIRVFDFDDKSELYSLTEHEPITSVCLSKDDKFLLVNLSVSEIHLWNLKDRTVDKKYFGQKQGRFVIRSCLGGIEENFVLSGSEDYQVYVWHRELGTIIENLPGHSACVNCVAWNPKKTMFASASDDQQIRIWGPGVNPYQKLGKEKLD